MAEGKTCFYVELESDTAVADLIVAATDIRQAYEEAEFYMEHTEGEFYEAYDAREISSLEALQLSVEGYPIERLLDGDAIAVEVHTEKKE